MEYIVKDIYGWIHLIASMVALIAGSMVLLLKKGTPLHKQIGYVYVVSMGILIATAFMIYRLFGGWGIFHYMTLVSLLTLGLGMIPIWIKKPVNNWQYLHFSFMYWSVIGVYAAFAAELFTRIPKTPFYDMVGLATGVIMLMGGVCFKINKPRWKKIFALEK